MDVTVNNLPGIGQEVLLVLGADLTPEIRPANVMIIEQATRLKKAVHYKAGRK